LAGNRILVIGTAARRAIEPFSHFSDNLRLQGVARGHSRVADLARGMHFSTVKNGDAMLRITRSQTESEQRWTLCGQLTGPCVAELHASWEHGRPENSHAVVDLSDVTFIDEAGENLLLEMRVEGAEFVATGVDTRYLLRHLRAKGERPVRRCIAHLAHRREKPGFRKSEESK
jgi:hypothetical protein